VKTAFKDAIADALLRHGGRADRAPVVRIAEVVDKLPDDIGVLRAPKDYDALSRHLAGLLRGGHALKPRQARDTAWCLWGTAEEIAADPATLEPFLQQMRELKNKSATRALVLSYLVSFHEDRPGLSAVAAALQDLASVAGAPFDDLAERLRLFDVREGPALLGEAAVAERSSPRALLEAQRVQMELVLAGGFVEASTRRALERVAADTRLSPAERLDFVGRISLRPQTQALLYLEHKSLVANALLLPLEAERPEKQHRDRILDFLVSVQDIGDPRTRSGNWVNMPRAREIAISWLTEQALRQFLDVVEAVNPNENWPYRRRFWEAMHDNGVISAAWVVLDSQGTREARRRFGRNTSFAEFETGGTQAGHAVLMLRIGTGVCVEWSFNGQCRFWNDHSREGAPQLFKDRYDAEFLRTGKRYAPVLEVRHMPHTGPNAWQHKVAQHITRMTGIRFSPRDYM